jgi:hypothetical protein
MRSINPTASALLASGSYELAQLVEMQLTSGTLRLATSGVDLLWSGHTWLGAAAIGSIGELEQAPGEIKGLEFTLTGVPDAYVALAMSENVQGRPCILRTVLADRQTWAIADVILEESLRLDVLRCTEGAIDQAGQPIQVAIVCTAESASIDLLRPRGLLYTDGHQQRLHAGDKGLEYVRDADLDIVWPDHTYRP